MCQLSPIGQYIGYSAWECFSSPAIARDQSISFKTDAALRLSILFIILFESNVRDRFFNSRQYKITLWCHFKRDVIIVTRRIWLTRIISFLLQIFRWEAFDQ